jgi:glucose/arabinose dehydrogenase
MACTSKIQLKIAFILTAALASSVGLPLVGRMLPDVFTDYKSQKPGATHRITPKDLPKPYATDSSRNNAKMISRPTNAWPQAPQGFKVELYAEGLDNPRLIRTAPNGDLFVAESAPGRIKVFRGKSKDGKFEQQEVFATGLVRPFGIAFYPPGPNPKYVYIGNTGSVVRFPYQNGDMKARGPQEIIVPTLPTGGGHWTRDLAFSLDGKKLFIAVGSSSNVDEGGDGSREVNRANVLTSNPDGSNLKVYASGIRNPVGLGVHPTTGEVWVSVNERDAIGDNLPPDYISSIKEGGFYGWPWYYIGGNQDPRHQGKHPELKDKVIVPDVLVQAHSASLAMTFYEGKQFPAEYSGDIFAAEHGSWNKSVRQGSVVICVPMKNGKATGEYTDFLTGFVTSDGDVWGRVVGVDVAKDGSLLVSDDGSNSLWRVSYVGK